MYTYLDITQMNGDGFAYDLEITKENGRSIWAIGMYGDTYRVNKNTNAVYKNGKKIATTCHFYKW